MGRVTCRTCGKKWESLAAHAADPCDKTCEEEAELKRRQKQQQQAEVVVVETPRPKMRIRVRQYESEVLSDYDTSEKAVYVEVPSVICIDITIRGGGRG